MVTSVSPGAVLCGELSLWACEVVVTGVGDELELVLEMRAAAGAALIRLSVSFSAASTRLPAGRRRLQHGHISTHQFFDGIRRRPFVPKGRGYLSWWTTEAA